MKTYDTEKPDACWELAKEALAAYGQKTTAGPGVEQSSCPESDGLRLVALEQTLRQFAICPRLYSLMGKDEDDTICLNYVDGAWVTYSVDRGQRHLVHPHMSFDLAALEFLDYLAKDQEGEAQLCFSFLKLSTAMLELESLEQV